MYSFFNDDDDYDADNNFEAALGMGAFVSLFWGVHWTGYIIYKCWKRIVLPLLTRLTLSKEERVMIAIGATPNRKENKL
jgi:hypothetical protein